MERTPKAPVCRDFASRNPRAPEHKRGKIHAKAAAR
jgi:hypothetical protein